MCLQWFGLLGVVVFTAVICIQLGVGSQQILGIWLEAHAFLVRALRSFETLCSSSAESDYVLVRSLHTHRQ